LEVLPGLSLILSAPDEEVAWVVPWAPLRSEADAVSGLADGALSPLFHHNNTAAASTISMAMMINVLVFMDAW
jgi:hypothetical protein